MWLSILALLLVVADSTGRVNDTFQTIKMLFGREVLNDPPRLNPALLAFAVNAYRIQSQILRIPDRFGLFSAGPPRLQVWEADMFVKGMLFPLSMMAALGLFAVWMLRVAGNPNAWKLGLVLLGLWVGCAVMLWVTGTQATEKRAAPGYVWKDWVENKAAGFSHRD